MERHSDKLAPAPVLAPKQERQSTPATQPNKKDESSSKDEGEDMEDVENAINKSSVRVGLPAQCVGMSLRHFHPHAPALYLRLSIFNF